LKTKSLNASNLVNGKLYLILNV